ncbi:MAG: translation initiation factor IF-6 [Methanomicrobiales archaeon]|nr:translation initiation factor IF-6 [Methanomicrobiales archaeon]
MSGTIDFAGEPHIGIFARVVGDLAVVPPDASDRFLGRLEEDLKVETVRTTVQGMRIIGSLVAGNSRGLVVSGHATKEEISALEEHAEVLPLKSRMNACGNIILANDSFLALHPELEEEVAEEVADFLGTRKIRLSLGGMKAVGMAAVATNRGIMVNPRASIEEIALLEEVSQLPVGRGSVNMGSGIVGSGLLVNERGYLAGFESSGFELGRIEEIFGFVE